MVPNKSILLIPPGCSFHHKPPKEFSQSHRLSFSTLALLPGVHLALKVKVPALYATLAPALGVSQHCFPFRLQSCGLWLCFGSLLFHFLFFDIFLGSFVCVPFHALPSSYGHGCHFPKVGVQPLPPRPQSCLPLKAVLWTHFPKDWSQASSAKEDWDDWSSHHCHCQDQVGSCIEATSRCFRFEAWRPWGHTDWKEGCNLRRFFGSCLPCSCWNFRHVTTIEL